MTDKDHRRLMREDMEASDEALHSAQGLGCALFLTSLVVLVLAAAWLVFGRLP